MTVSYSYSGVDMKIFSTLLVLVLISVAHGQDQGFFTDEALLQRADPNRLARITAEPVPMNPAASALCAPLAAFLKRDHATLVQKQNASIHVYVSPEAAQFMKPENEAAFPVGTVLLKQKITDDKTRRTILYTGMLKREQGYNPECGDWEFFTLDGDRKSLTSRGRIESCMSCHKQYSRSDFVTKEYPIRVRGPVLR